MIFKVTEVTKNKFGFWSITAKVLELSIETWYRHLYRVRQNAYSFWGHRGQFGVTGINFRVTVINFGVTGA